MTLVSTNGLAPEAMKLQLLPNTTYIFSAVQSGISDTVHSTVRLSDSTVCAYVYTHKGLICTEHVPTTLPVPTTWDACIILETDAKGRILKDRGTLAREDNGTENCDAEDGLSVLTMHNDREAVAKPMPVETVATKIEAKEETERKEKEKEKEKEKDKKKKKKKKKKRAA